MIELDRREPTYRLSTEALLRVSGFLVAVGAYALLSLFSPRLAATTGFGFGFLAAVALWAGGGFIAYQRAAPEGGVDG